MKTLGMVFVSILGAFWWGWFISILWAWFVVPLGVASITVFHGVGIRTLSMLLTFKQLPKERPDYLESIALMLVAPPVFLIPAAIAKGLMP